MVPETDHPSETTNTTPVWVLPLILVMILIGAGVATAVITGGPAATPPAPPAATQAPIVAAPTPAAPAIEPTALPEAHGGIDPNGPAVADIAIAAAQARFEANSAVFIDIRGSEEYAGGRIPGALTITSPDLNSRLAELPPGTAIIVYGDATRPEAGRRGAQIFAGLGFGEVAALDGGIEAWQAAGLPVEQ